MKPSTTEDLDKIASLMQVLTEKSQRQSDLLDYVKKNLPPAGNFLREEAIEIFTDSCKSMQELEIHERALKLMRKRMQKTLGIKNQLVNSED